MNRTALRTPQCFFLLIAISPFCGCTPQAPLNPEPNHARKGSSPDWPLDFYERRSEQIAKEVEAGDRPFPANGVISLQHQENDLSITGKVYAARQKDGTIRLFFPSWLNPSGVGGHLYCSTPLNPKALQEDSTGNLTAEVVIPGNRAHQTRMKSIQILRRLEPHWYVVEYREPNHETGEQK